MSIKIGDLSKEIAKNLTQYTDQVKEQITEAQDDLSKEGVRLLKMKKFSGQSTGEYSKSWTRKKTKNGYVIHNKKYQLTHLLENGHAKVNGGRVPAIPHIRPVEQQIVDRFIKDVEKAVKG